MRGKAFAAIGDKLITEADLVELNGLHLRGFQLREQMEALTARACEILGVGALGDMVCQDFAEEIIHFGTPPMEAIRNIQDRI